MEFFGGIRLVFIEKSLLILIGKLCDINRGIIRQTFESLPVQCPFPVFGRKFFDGLCDNKCTLSQMVERAVLFRGKSCITAVNELLAAKLLKDFCLQGL